MAFYNKMGSLLRQSVSANNALNGQVSMGSMFNSIRCMSSSRPSSRPFNPRGSFKDVIGRLRSSLQEEDVEKAKKFGSTKVCLGSSYAEHNRIKRNLYHFKSLFLSRTRNEKNQNIPTRTVSSIVDNFVFHRSTYCSATSPRLKALKRKVKRINLPTHYCEVNYRTQKAVVFYGPSVRHIPHKIKSRDINLML